MIRISSNNDRPLQAVSPHGKEKGMERDTGFEPATSSLGRQPNDITRQDNAVFMRVYAPGLAPFCHVLTKSVVQSVVQRHFGMLPPEDSMMAATSWRKSNHCRSAMEAARLARRSL